MARDIYQEVTDTILAQLEKGVRPWQRPWETGVEAEKPAPTLPLRHNGEPYRGTNVVLLWSAASERGYDKPTTYRRAQVFVLVAEGQKMAVALALVVRRMLPLLADSRRRRVQI